MHYVKNLVVNVRKKVVKVACFGYNVALIVCY